MEGRGDLEASQGAAQGVAPSAGSTRPHVLLVEDSPVAREKISGILRDLGCAVTAAADGVEGLRQVKEHGASLGLIVLDIQMPRMDGMTVLRHLRQLPALAQVPIVMLTTQADKDTVRTALAHRANDFIRKDASIPVIAERLRAHLQSGRPARTRAAAGAAPSGELAQQILRDQRPATSPISSPWVLFYESRSGVQDMLAGKNPALVQFYAQAVEAVGRLNRVYRGLDVGYRLEQDRQAATRLAQQQGAPPRLLLVSGRQAEGASVARMVRFTRGRDLPIYLVCESQSSVSLEQQGAMKKADVALLERRQLGPEQWASLYAAHLLPKFRTTESGLQFHELTSGSGAGPEPGQMVAVRCTGTLTDGTVCLQPGEGEPPCRFIPGQGEVVPAWEEAVRLMRPGGRALVVAGPELAYGAGGDGNLVPPEATVVFDLELVEVSGVAVGDDEDGEEAPPQDQDLDDLLR
ncbi:MAG: response regulator [Candidatus Latescibacterota bacterium]